MNKEEKVINYYVLCNKLKTVIRTGWKDWNVKKDRLESVAEHIYGTQMLAIAMKSEYEYDIDILKVIYMLAIHELGEIIIGDLTHFQISKEDKHKKELEAVRSVIGDLIDKEEIESIYLEFEDNKTAEAIFAHFCDKLECDLQCKLYDEEGLVDLNKQENNKSFFDKNVQDLFKEYDSWSKMWLKYGQNRYQYDDNFLKVSEYAFKNKIRK